MDELKSYLEESKQRRAKSVRKACRVLKKTKKTESNNAEANENFPRITPKKFRIYEEKVREQIQNIYYKDYLKTLDEERKYKKRHKKRSSKELSNDSTFSSIRFLSNSRLQYNPLMIELKKRLHQKALIKSPSKHLILNEKSPKRMKKNSLNLI